MGKTVTTYLIDGDPKGTQYAFIRNTTCQMFIVPRSNLSYLNTQEKLQKPAFYILLGEDEATKPQAYIGEAENYREAVLSRRGWQVGGHRQNRDHRLEVQLGGGVPGPALSGCQRKCL